MSYNFHTTRTGRNFARLEHFVETSLNIAPLLLDTIKVNDDRTRRVEAIYNAPSPLTPLSFESPEFGPGDSQFETPSSTPAEADIIHASSSQPVSNTTKTLLRQTSARLVQHEVQSRRDKRKARFRGHRKEVHDLKMAKHSARVNRKTKSQISKRNSGYGAVIVLTDFKVADISIAPGGDIGCHRPAEKSLPTLASLMSRPGYRYIPNDGSTSLGVVDPDGTLLAGIFTGPAPRNASSPSWDTAIEDMSSLMERLRREEDVSFLRGETHHRRGNYTLVSSGITHGNGRKIPGNLRERHPAIVEELKNSEAVRRVVGHQDALFRYNAPKLYAHCADQVDELLAHHQDLQRPFSHSVYTTFTANMGPASSTFKHVDSQNDAHVWCAITNGGHFDFRKGAHLVLYDFKLIIEFPPGCTAILPSATVSHGNTAIGPGETRYSLTQYINGALFRWVRHGFRPASGLTRNDRAERDGDAEDRCAKVLGMFSKTDEILLDRECLL